MDTKKLVKLYLDDIRTPKTEGWIIIRSYENFVKHIQENGLPDEISFDHDLACYKDGVEYTGKSAVDYLIDYCLDNNKKFPDWYAHTDNTSGKRNIIGAILNYINKVEGKDITNFRYYHNGIVNNKPV
jgi:hypothetical protein